MALAGGGMAVLAAVGGAVARAMDGGSKPAPPVAKPTAPASPGATSQTGLTDTVDWQFGTDGKVLVAIKGQHVYALPAG